MGWSEIIINDFQEYSKLANDLGVNVGNRYRWNFRGQADSSWQLKPSLLRLLDGIDDFKVAGLIEDEVLTDFLLKKDLYLPNRQPKLDYDRAAWWAIMQHHSCPTRLLDWSVSPYVAAYFAVCNSPHKDGAIWIFNATVLTDIMTKQYGTTATIPENNMYYNENCPPIIRSIRAIDSPRLAAQQGVFTVCTNIMTDHSAIIDSVFGNYSNQYLMKVIIPSNLKNKILSQLHTMNITAASLFPGIDGLGQTMAELIKLRVYHRDNPV